ncbi:MAG: enoyl-CoA hydratase-related protein [Myxococcota bacterium]
MAGYETILYEVKDGIARLTLNRPERLNGMTNRMVVETHEALVKTAEDKDVRVLVLTGAGRGFCPGADMGHYTSGDASEGEVSLTLEHFHVPRVLHEMPAVTIAAVNGACAGAGFGWACGCDLRFAARSANFSTAFLRVAFAGDMGLPWSLPRLVGGAKARELSLLCEKFSAEEAAQIGLVARVFADDGFRTEVDAIVGQLARRSPTALLTLKAHYVAAEQTGLAEFIEQETRAHIRIGQSPDTQEAFRAFLEKREPNFARS